MSTPYSWDNTSSPSDETLQLWTEVGEKLEKKQEIVWRKAVESLDEGNKYLKRFKEASNFVEQHMFHTINIFLQQNPYNIGSHKRNCVQASLKLAVSIVAQDLDIQNKRQGECRLLDVLSLVFNKNMTYYKFQVYNGDRFGNVFQPLPQRVWFNMIHHFSQHSSGFARLERYLLERIISDTPRYPKLELLHQILEGIGNAIVIGKDNIVFDDVEDDIMAVIQDDAISLATAVVEFIKETNIKTLEQLETIEHVGKILHDLQRIFDYSVSSRRHNTYMFYDFWRAFILELVISQSTPLKMLGWEQMMEIVKSSEDHAPPPKAVIVAGAGCSFVNGTYSFEGELTEDGRYLPFKGKVAYQRQIPDTEKTITLFRCKMRSEQKWWFLSEADEEQPGTDVDIDYYQNKPRRGKETAVPAESGWTTCKNRGIDPPPLLKLEGMLVPPEEEFNTLEYRLAKWAIENRIMRRLLLFFVTSDVNSTIFTISLKLIKFLLAMCEKYPPIKNKWCSTETDHTIELLQRLHTFFLLQGKEDQHGDCFTQLKEFCFDVKVTNSLCCEHPDIRGEFIKLLRMVQECHQVASCSESRKRLKHDHNADDGGAGDDANGNDDSDNETVEGEGNSDDEETEEQGVSNDEGIEDGGDSDDEQMEEEGSSND